MQDEVYVDGNGYWTTDKAAADAVAEPDSSPGEMDFEADSDRMIAHLHEQAQEVAVVHHPHVPESEFRLADYAIPKKMEKSMATHHDFQTFTYYAIPEEKNDALMTCIVVSMLRNEPMCLCEHKVKKGRNRLYLDVDTPMDFTVFQEMVPKIQSVITKLVPSAVITPETVSKLVEYGINMAAPDEYMCVALRSSVGSPEHNKYHIVWPFIKIFQRSECLVLKALKDALPTIKLEIPATMRAPFCDKAKDGIKLGRPYVYSCVCDKRGKVMREDQMLCPSYPIKDASSINPDNYFEYLRSVFVLTSIRMSQGSIDRVVKIDSTANATEWSKQKRIYCPVELQSLLENCESEQDKIDTVVDYVNQSCAFTNFGGNMFYMRKVTDDRGELFLSSVSSHAMSNVLSAPLVKLGKQRISPFRIWNSDVRRNVIMAKSFSPGKTTAVDVINTWKGFRYTQEEAMLAMHIPSAGFCLSNFLAHVFNVVCAQDYDVFNQVVNWFAHIVQNPSVSNETLLMILGQEGCGKSFTAATFGHLFGDSYMRTNSVDDVIGRFNSRCEGKILIHVDEVDELSKHQISVLKAMVTDPVKRFEEKYVMQHHACQPVNIIFTSNQMDDDMLNVGPNARRWIFLDSVSYPECTKEYFQSMSDFLTGDMEAGYKKLFCFLNSLDLTGYNHRKAFDTRGLIKRKYGNMRDVHEFFWECMEKGYLALGVLSSNKTVETVEWKDDYVDIPLTLLYASYEQFCHRRNNRPSKYQTFISRAQEVTNMNISMKKHDDYEDRSSGKIRSHFVKTVTVPGTTECRQLFAKYYTGQDLLTKEHKLSSFVYNPCFNFKFKTV